MRVSWSEKRTEKEEEREKGGKGGAKDGVRLGADDSSVLSSRRYSFRVWLSHRKREPGPAVNPLYVAIQISTACARNERSCRHSGIICILFSLRPSSIGPLSCRTASQSATESRTMRGPKFVSVFAHRLRSVAFMELLRFI